MKKINLIICFLILIGFSFIYKPINVDAYQTRFYWDIDGYINNDRIYSNYYQINNYKYLPTNTPVTGKVAIKIFGNIYDNVVENPSGLSLNISISTCTTGVPLNVVDYSTVSGHFLFTGLLSSKNIGPCSVAGYTGTLREVQFSLYVNNSFYDVDGDFWYSLGYVNVLAPSPTKYGSFFNFVSVNVETANIENKIIIDQQTQIIEDTRTIWQKIADLPSDLWNFIKNIPSQVWNFFSGAFDLVVNGISNIGGFIIDLPGHIWNGIKTGFNWIVDGISDLFDFFNNDDDVDVSGLSSIGLLPAGAVDSILNLPFTFLDNLNTNLNKQCKAVNIPLPYVNKNLPLPCVNTIYTQISGLSVFISGISVILASFILFKYLINLYKWVDKTLSLKDNNHLDNWGGL